MIHRLICIQILVVAASAFSFADTEETTSRKEIVTKVHKVGDLEFFTHDQEGWNFSSLVETLKTKTGDDETTITAYPQNLCLVVSTTKDNHKIIAKTIKQDQAKSKGQKKVTVLTRVYKVGDLASFTQGKNDWDPVILLELLKTKIGDDDTTSFAPYPQNLSIIISATQENHDIVVETIEGLRPKK